MRPPIRDLSAVHARMNEQLRLDRRRTVAMTIDMQRMYLDPTIPGKTLAADEARAVVACSSRFLDACRAIGVPVVHVYVNRREAEIEARIGLGKFVESFRENTTDAAAGNDVPDRLEGSPQAELPRDIVRDGDIHVRGKKTTDSFLGTELDLLFARALRPNTVVILGINTETCVHAGAFGCSVRGYRPVIASDCVGSHRGADNTWLSLELLSRTIAWVLPSDAIVEKLRRGEAP